MSWQNSDAAHAAQIRATEIIRAAERGDREAVRRDLVRNPEIGPPPTIGNRKQRRAAAADWRRGK